MSHVLDDLDFFTECIDKGQWFMIRKQNWAALFEHCPEWIRHFPQELWDEEHWYAAVRALPVMAAECPFELKAEKFKKKESGFAWDSAEKNEKVRYVIKHPEYYEQLCQEEDLEVFDRIQIFDENPELAENFDWTDIQKWSINHKDRNEVGFYWSFLLNSNPQFAPYCPCLQEVGSGAYCAILRYKPELLDGIEIKWQEFSRYDWEYLLPECPQYADKCDWSQFDEGILQTILQAQPDLVELADFSCFTAAIWSDVLLKKPDYITRCPEDMLLYLNWEKLLCEHPHLYEYFPKSEYAWWDKIVRIDSDYLKDCPWDKLDGRELGSILRSHPEYIDKVPLKNLDGRDWSLLLIAHPHLARYCRWGKFKGKDWVYLILNTRGFTELCRWDKLTGDDWVDIIIRFPSYFKKCPKNKLKKQSWLRLMLHYPHLGKHCPYWNTFNEQQWYAVLKYHGDHAWRCPQKMRPKLAEAWFWEVADQWHIEHDK